MNVYHRRVTSFCRLRANLQFYLASYVLGFYISMITTIRPYPSYTILFGELRSCIIYISMITTIRPYPSYTILFGELRSCIIYISMITTLIMEFHDRDYESFNSIW